MCPREPPSPNISKGDSFLFSGNRHETVPRALFLDMRLTPLERNAWQIIRLQLLDNDTTVFPSYEQLRPLLASVPCGAKASHETIAKALTLLRLSRWLSLVQRRRDAKTGRLQGNLYVLHDEPLTPFETLQLDPEYLELVSHALDHLNKAVQCVAIQVLKEISDDPRLHGKLLPTRVQVLMQRLDRQSEVGGEALLRIQPAPASESEAGVKPAPQHCLRIPKQDSTLSTKAKKKLRTETPDLRWPRTFTALKPAQQTAARMALGQVDGDLQQAVLDEWSTRCRQQQVHNPAGYLFGIIQKALKGEFTPWAAPTETVPPSASPPAASAAIIRDPEVAEAHMAELRALLRLRHR